MDIDRKPLRVLLVEDDEIDRLAFERFVRKDKLPYEYSVAVSVEEGRMLLESHRYDVVLLDYMLGDGTGFDLLDVIRPDTPVIFVTGTGDEETAVKAIKSGAVDYLIKDPEGNYLTILPVTVDNAIRTKKLEEEVKRYQSHLEEMVEERTIQLQETNEQLRGEILERKQTEERLRESEEKFRSYIENAPDGVFIVDDTGRYIEANKSACLIIGYSKEEIEKLSIYDLLSEESLEAGLVHFKKLMETGAAISDLWLKRKDGSKRCLTVNAARLSETRFLGFGKDVTEQNNTERKVRESEEKYRLLADNTVDCIWVMNINTEFTYINPAIEPMMGFTSEEWIGSRLEDHCDSENFNKMLLLVGEELGRPPHDEAITFEASMLNRDNKNVSLEIRSRVIYDEKGEPVGLQGTTRDITERKQAEERMEKSLREKEALLKEIHHRVKNNMQIIASMLSLQSDQSMDEKIVSIMKQNESRIKSMALIHEKLYLSPDLSSVNFAEYMESLALHLSQAHGIEPDRITIVSHVADISFEIETAIPCGLIINELISNAIKHAFLEGRKGEIAVALQRNPDHTLTLLVSDNGIGLPEDIDMPSRETFGMQLVGILTEQIDGTLEIVRGEGTTFRITFRELKYKKRT